MTRPGLVVTIVGDHVNDVARAAQQLPVPPRHGLVDRLLETLGEALKTFGPF